MRSPIQIMAKLIKTRLFLFMHIDPLYHRTQEVNIEHGENKGFYSSGVGVTGAEHKT